MVVDISCTDSKFGNSSTYEILLQAFEELERLFTNRGICVAVKEKLTKDSGVAGAGDYDHIVEKLLAKPKARGTV